MTSLKDRLIKAFKLNIFSRISVILFFCGFSANSGGLYISLYHGLDGPWLTTGTSLAIITLLFIYIVLIKEKYSIFNIVVTATTGVILFPLIFLSSDGVRSVFPIFMLLIPISYGVSTELRYSAPPAIVNIILYDILIWYDWIYRGHNFGWCSISSFLIAFTIVYITIYSLAALVATVALSSIHKLEKLYKTDDLTQIYNRYAFDNDISEYKKVCKVAIFDIDNFKLVNDTYTHKEGDKVLIKFANILKKYSCEEFRVYRWGGEEFAVISMLNETLTLQCIKSIIVDVRNELKDPKNNSITVSCGLYYSRNYNSKVDSVKMADTYLYEAKNSGKNRLVFNGEQLFVVD